MTEAADPSPSRPPGSLGAVSQVFDLTEGSGAALRRLTEAAAEAVGAHGGALVAVDREGESRVEAEAGLSDGAAASLARAVLAPRDEAFVDVAGVGRALVCPFRSGHGVRGALALVGSAVEASSEAGRQVARAAAARAGAMLESDALRSDLDRAMAQILESDERMMGRIGLDIHDGPTQQLSVALLEVQLLEAELDDAARAGAELPADLRPALMRIYETLGGALHEMRELIGHLRPAQFEDRALDDIVRDCAVAFEARGDVAVAFEARGEFAVNGVSISQRITFYRVLQEALSNAHRHGKASHVEVTLTETDGGVELVVRDDGEGFDDAAAFRKSERGPQSRVGLRGMRDRAQVLGGTFEVASRPGEGTTVRLFIPSWRPPEQDAGAL